MSYIDEILGVDGAFARSFPGYETRGGQMQFCHAVDQAITGRTNLLAEAPCGTGKAVGYSLPASYHAHHGRKKIVIATFTKALQEQLVLKDLPALKNLVPWPFTFALLKGRHNFLCKRQETATWTQASLIELHGKRKEQRDHVHGWRPRTQTGDLAELPFELLSQVRDDVAVTSDDCVGDGCKDYDACCYNEAKAIACQADIIVTNFHMLFAHLAFGHVLPIWDTLILDEAHEAPDVAREFFGYRLTIGGIHRIAARIEKLLEAKPLTERLIKAAEPFFDAVTAYGRSELYRVRLKDVGFVDPEPTATVLDDAARRTAAIVEHERAAMEKHEPHDRLAMRKAENLFRDVTRTAVRLREVAAQSDSNRVYWIDLPPPNTRKPVALCSKPIDAGPVIASTLYDAFPERVVVAASATLTERGTFDFVRRELGMPETTTTLVVESPFDFSRQARLIVPRGVPRPDVSTEDGKRRYLGACIAVLTRVIEDCHGRTLCLFTSNEAMEACFSVLSDGLQYTLLKQRDHPTKDLVAKFKEDTHSVLFGVATFWTGIDVPGEALTAVVIDKLPFAPPSDPVMDALSARDPDHFFHRHLLPKTIIRLRQGVGRLIRSRSDVGVIVIVDPRVADKGYGQQILRSLVPSIPMTRDLGAVAAFLAGGHS